MAKLSLPKPASINNPTSYSEYAAYMRAKGRCRCVSNGAFHDYGGRGIEFRFTSFEEFYYHIGPRPSPLHSLDRKDNTGHYEKGNVRWATREEQNRNTRRNVMLTIGDQTQTVSEWAADAGIDARMVFSRLAKGWTPQRAVFGPVQEHKRRMAEKVVNIVSWRTYKKHMLSGNVKSVEGCLTSLGFRCVGRVRASGSYHFGAVEKWLSTSGLDFELAVYHPVEKGATIFVKEAVGR